MDVSYRVASRCAYMQGPINTYRQIFRVSNGHSAILQQLCMYDEESASVYGRTYFVWDLYCEQHLQKPTWHREASCAKEWMPSARPLSCCWLLLRIAGR
jgi:hypothetical protein